MSSVLLAAVCIAPSTQAVETTTVALTGDIAPGAEADAQFTAFEPGFINASGRVAFDAEIDGVNTPEGRRLGIWSTADGPLDLVLREGDPMPHPGNASVAATQWLTAAHLSDAGGVTFFSTHAGFFDPQFNYTPAGEGYWRSDSGQVTPVIVEGQDVAYPHPFQTYTLNAFYTAPYDPIFNASGAYAFPGSISSGKYGMLTGVDGQVSATAMHGDKAVVDPPGEPSYYFGSGLWIDFTFNDAGQLAFKSTPPGSRNDGEFHTVWRGAPGAIELLAMGEAPAPGVPGGKFGSFGMPVINNAGHVAFHAEIAGNFGTTFDPGQGFFADVGSGLQRLVVEGDPATDAGPGATFWRFYADSLVLNGSSDIAFLAELEGLPAGTPDNGLGIWTQSDGVNHLVAMSGDEAPGVADEGVVFDIGLSRLAFNSAGNLVFGANLVGPGTVGGSGGNRKGVWGTDANGVLRLIARQGDLFDVSDDPAVQDLRVIDSIQFGAGLPFESTGGQDNRQHVLNEAGEFVFLLRFTDGSEGVFIADLNANLLPADLSGDGDVDDQDLGLFFSSFTGPGQGPPANALADLSGDGDVDDEDLGLAFSAFTGPLAPINVPEPAALAPLAGLVVLRRWRV